MGLRCLRASSSTRIERPHGGGWANRQDIVPHEALFVMLDYRYNVLGVSNKYGSRGLKPMYMYIGISASQNPCKK